MSERPNPLIVEIKPGETGWNWAVQDPETPGAFGCLKYQDIGTVTRWGARREARRWIRQYRAGRGEAPNFVATYWVK